MPISVDIREVVKTNTRTLKDLVLVKRIRAVRFAANVESPSEISVIPIKCKILFKNMRDYMVELTRIELVTFCMPCRRSPS